MKADGGNNDNNNNNKKTMPLIHSNGKDCWSCYLLRAELSNALVFSLVFLFLLVSSRHILYLYFLWKKRKKKNKVQGFSSSITPLDWLSFIIISFYDFDRIIVSHSLKQTKKRETQQGALLATFGASILSTATWRVEGGWSSASLTRTWVMVTFSR